MTLKTPSLKELATSISEQASTLQEYLEKNGKQQPSFNTDGLRSWGDFPDIREARLGLIEAATDILHLATGPSDYFRTNALTMKWDQFAVGALNQWNVYDNVPLGGSISYTELATKCKVPEPRLRRVLKHAMTMHIFWAPTTDTVAHTNTSAELAREELLYAWVGHQIEECGSSATKLTEAIDRWGDSNDIKESAIILAHPDAQKEYDTFFEFLSEDGEGQPSAAIAEGRVDKLDRTRGWRARRFGNAMKYMNISGPHASKSIHDGFDWDMLGRATVVDMGGSVGHMSVELASQHPDLILVVQDFAALEPQFHKTVPKDLNSRISFQVHDFFTPQTVKADVYFLKHILHDWPDALCVKIIQNIIPAMQKGNRIVIMDGVMPELGEAPNSIVKLNTSLDLQMMAALNAKERTRKDWTDLIGSADPRLTVKAFKQPPGSAASLIEVVFEG